MRRSAKKQHLIDVATQLFNRMGYHGAGIDAILAEAGVAKTTLYRHFPSKEELIVAALRRADEQFRQDMRLYVDKYATDAKAKILLSFDYLAHWFEGKGFYGCPFLGAASEYTDRNSPVFQEALMHKRLMIAYFEELCRAAMLENPSRLAFEIHLLHEGATAVAHINADAKTAQHAKAAAARLLAWFHAVVIGCEWNIHSSGSLSYMADNPLQVTLSSERQTHYLNPRICLQRHLRRAH